MSRYWYSYSGPAGSEYVVSNYNLVSSNCCCPGGCFICKISAIYGGDSHPVSLSSRLIDYIALAKHDCLSQPRTGPTFVLTE